MILLVKGRPLGGERVKHSDWFFEICFFKVPLTSKILFSFNKTYYLTDYSPWLLEHKIILIDKIPTFLQELEHVISMFTTAQNGIWVRLLVTSLWEPG